MINEKGKNESFVQILDKFEIIQQVNLFSQAGKPVVTRHRLYRPSFPNKEIVTL